MNLTVRKSFVSKLKEVPIPIILVSVILLIDSLYCLNYALQAGYFLNHPYLPENPLFRRLYWVFLATSGFATAVGAINMKRWSVIPYLILTLSNQAVLMAFGIRSILELIVALIPLLILVYYFKRMT
jgi:hypothetical protein